MAELISENDVVGLTYGLEPELDPLRKAVLDLRSTAAYYRKKSEAYFALHHNSVDLNDPVCDGVRNGKINSLYETAAKNATLVLIQLRRDLERAICPWLKDASDEAVEEEIRETEEIDQELIKNHLSRLSPEYQARFKQFTGFSL